MQLAGVLVNLYLRRVIASLLMERDGIHLIRCLNEEGFARPQRVRFAAIAKIVKQMMADGSKKSRKQLWKIATKAYDEKNQ